MRKTSTKAIVEGALLLGILVILSVLSYYLPLTGIVTFAFLPIPIIFAVIRHNIKVAVMMGILLVATLIIVGINPIFAAVDSIYATFTGLALGYGFSKKLSPTTTYIITSAATLLAGALIVFLIGGFLQIDIIGEAVETQFTIMEMVVESVYDSPEEMQILIAQMREQLSLLLPAILIMVALIYGYLNYVLSRMVLRKFKIEVEGLPSFKNWRLTKLLPWTFIITIILGAYILPLVFGPTIPAYIVTINFSINQIALMGIAIQGLAVTYFYLSKWIKISFARVLLIIFLSMTFSPIIILLGLVDFYWDIRSI